MKRVAVTTYCEYTSYGSILQALGLKKSLKDIGFESFIIKDTPAPPVCLPKSKILTKNVKRLIVNLLNLRIKNCRQNHYNKNLKFIHDNIDIVYYNDYQLLVKNPPKADYYLAGSDQIWHPALCKPAFFLDFVPNGQKRLSYAASMGVTEIPSKNKEKFVDLIGKIDAFSVREANVKDVLKEYITKDIEVHIDPTFLRAAEEWRSYEKPYPLKKPYILLYTIYWDKRFHRELKRLKKQSKYDIVAICSSINSVFADKKIYDAGPDQFLWLIDHAEAVVTSSFHGVAFSIIFNKKLAAVINPKAPSRIENVLKTLNVQNTSISEVLDFDMEQYTSVNKRIEQERQRSFEYLKQVLSNE